MLKYSKCGNNPCEEFEVEIRRERVEVLFVRRREKSHHVIIVTDGVENITPYIPLSS